MAESFENEDNILRDWANRTDENRYEKQEEVRKSRFFLRKCLLEQPQSAVERV